jgi:hypothetical protein
LIEVLIETVRNSNTYNIFQVDFSKKVKNKNPDSDKKICHVQPNKFEISYKPENKKRTTF